ncbi:hypothetical protein ACFE04_003488 [Oxalis oulophora]
MTSLSDVCPDIMFDILAKLSRMSIFYCRFVSKLWRDIIDDPRFVTIHLMNEVVEGSQLVSFDFGEETRMRLIQPNDSTTLKPLKHPIVEILLKKQYNLSLDDSNDPIFFLNHYVCDGIFFFLRINKTPVLLNPLTREFVELPPLPPQPPQHEPFHQRNLEVYGIGFDFESKVHKAVHISVNNDISYPTTTQVITLGREKSWREISTKFTRHIDAETIVTTRGYLHWLGRVATDEFHENIFSFDIAKEESMSTLCPKPHTSMWRSTHLTTWKQSLGVVYFFAKNTRIEVWIKKDLKSKEWAIAFKTSNVNLKAWFVDSGLTPPRPCLPKRMIGVWNNGFLFEIIQGTTYMLYDPNKDKVEYLKVSPPPSFGELDTFTPNLTSLATYGFQVIGHGSLHCEDLFLERERFYI